MNDISKIIESCKRGEELAWKIIYDRFSTQMRALCYRYLGDLSDAEDVMQDCFIKVFTKIDQYKGDGPFEAWLRQIFVNASLKFIRSKKNLPISLEEDLYQYK